MPREEPPVATWGRPFGDFAFSYSLGWSQLRVRGVVEKHRESGRDVKDAGKAIRNGRYQYRKLFMVAIKDTYQSASKRAIAALQTSSTADSLRWWTTCQLAANKTVEVEDSGIPANPISDALIPEGKE